MDVMERWLRSAYEAGYIHGPGHNPVILWSLSDDCTLSPVLQNDRRCQHVNPNGGRCILDDHGHAHAHLYSGDTDG
jgi:hypothetical protein